MGNTYNESAESIHASQVFLTATDGFFSVSSLGENANFSVASQNINLNGQGAFINLLSGENGNGINLSAGADEGCIQLNTPGSGFGTFLAMTPTGMVLSNGMATAPGSIQLGNGQIVLSLGNPLTGSMLTMTPDSITLKVGTATLTLTAEGLSTSVGDTLVEVGPSGVCESSGPISRELGPAGHTLEAGEASLEVGMSGLAVSGPTGSLAFDATGQLSSAMATESADGMLNLQGPMVNVGS